MVDIGGGGRKGGGVCEETVPEVNCDRNVYLYIT